MRRGCPENTGKDVEKNPEKRFTGPGTSAILATIKGSKGQSAGPGPCRLLHGSVNTVEIPDAMCSLETFVTDMVLWQGSFFLLQRQDRKEAMNEHEFLECIRQSLFQFWKSDLADGRDVGDRCAAHLPCNRKEDGTEPASAHGLWRSAGEPAAFRCNHTGRYGRPHLGSV